jgi:hypothetical protein
MIDDEAAQRETHKKNWQGEIPCKYQRIPPFAIAYFFIPSIATCAEGSTTPQTILVQRLQRLALLLPLRHVGVAS